MKPELFYLIALLWIATVVVLLWFGNKRIFSYLDKRLPWLKHISKRFFAQLFLSVFYSLACINATYYLFRLQTSITSPTWSQFFVLNIYGLLFIIPVLAVNFSVYFVSQWKKAEMQSNYLREENLRTQLDSLRMQLDPHFLFNNLNVLSSLIDSDPHTAQHFLDKFADVYRYVLQYKNEELVPLATELDFIESYVYLLKKRFGSQLKVDIDVPDDLPFSLFIPPLSLQMLVENALKHNKISGKAPFVIDIFVEDGLWITVRNTYNPREDTAARPGKTGLDNIGKRYGFLSSKKIRISKDDSYFIVSLPLLDVTG